MRNITTGESVIIALFLLFLLSIYCADAEIGCTPQECPRCFFVMKAWHQITDIGHDAVNLLGG